MGEAPGTRLGVEPDLHDLLINLGTLFCELFVRRGSTFQFRFGLVSRLCLVPTVESEFGRLEFPKQVFS